MTWEEFLAKEVIKENKTVVISGTHGKTTICSLLTQLLSREINNLVDFFFRIFSVFVYLFGNFYKSNDPHRPFRRILY